MLEKMHPRQLSNKSTIPQHFLRMYSRKALHNARWYLKHEQHVLETLLLEHSYIDHVVVVGSGPNAYLELAKQFSKTYIGIDPYYPIHVSNDHTIIYFDSPVENIQRAQLPSGVCIFIFWFNVLHYLSNPEQAIAQLSRPGDVIVHSTWSAQSDARLAMNLYFKEVYRNTNWCYKKAIARVREKSSQYEAQNLFAFCKNKTTYENNINKCDVYLV